MKILLQHRRNRLYFRRPGVWTSDFHAAYDFLHTNRAIEFAHAHDLAEDVQLVVKFLDSEDDQVVPIPPPPCAVA
jgi:hypothetical protein